METRNYWILDCIVALTAIVLGATGLCSFAVLAMMPRGGATLSVETVVCAFSVVLGLVFARLAWRARREGRPGDVLRHARLLRQVLERHGRRRAVARAFRATPETLLATSLVRVRAERGRQIRRAMAAALAV
jgi:hypothetical protein